MTETANVSDVIAIPVFFIVVGLMKLDSVPSGGFIPGVVSKSIPLKSIPCSRILSTIENSYHENSWVKCFEPGEIVRKMRPDSEVRGGNKCCKVGYRAG